MNNSLIAQLIADGPEKLHVLADFDNTLTKKGTKNGSLISILYNEGYLSPEYQTTAQGFYEKYSKIEKDETLPLEYRKEMMIEWRTEHKKILINEGLTKDHIFQAIQSENVAFRDGYQTFFSFLHQNNIPLVILSAGGLGVVSIEKYLENHKVLFDNISIVGNDFERDENGKAIGFKQPLITSLNKSETVLQSFPDIYAKIKDRKNVLLLGDSLAEVDMIEGFDYDKLLKIGFLNSDVEANLARYQEVYDIVIVGDGSLDEVNEILSDIM